MFKRTTSILFFYTGILFLSEIIHRYIFNIPAPVRYIETFAILLVVVSLFYFAKYKITRIIIVIFFSTSVLLNNIHYAVYEGWITSTNYLLMFTEITEVTRTGITMLDRIWATSLWALLEILFFLSLSRFRVKTSPIADILLFIGMSYMSIRSFKTDNDIGLNPRPYYSKLKANSYSFHSFIGRIIPYELFKLSKVADYIYPMPKAISEPQIKHIILITGESLSAKNAHVFGYDRQTTPFLDSMIKMPEAIVKETYAAGLGTAISLPAFFNAVPYPNGLKQIAKGDTNLFNLAKKQGFSTEYHSSQPEWEMEILGLMGKAWIDHVTFPTEQGFSVYESMNDHKLLPYLEKINLDDGKKHFIVLHQRGSHGPYAKDLSDEERIFKGDTALDKYDSTIYNTDLFIQKVYEYLKQRPNDDWLLIYTSDHGQYVTQTVYNQGTIHEASYLVPTMIYTPNVELQQKIKQTFEQCLRIYHQQVSTFIIQTLGFNMPVSQCQEGVINAHLLSGNSGYLEVKGDKVEFKYPQKEH
ncbi:protein DcaA [Pasteurellaceae bacterium Macca]|nr:protein DcaA [Pasteurellaceae bacterium Macca]